LQGLVMLQKKIETESPTRAIFHFKGGSQGSVKPVLIDGQTKSRDPRGPGMEGTAIRGISVVPPEFWDSRSDLMWTPPPGQIELNESDQSLTQTLQVKFGDAVAPVAPVCDMLTLQVAENRFKDVLRYLKTEASPRYQRMDDLTAIDESARRQPKDDADYTMIYHLLSFDSASRLRLKVPLKGPDPVSRSITDIWPSANWYEREVFDLMGVGFEGHPNLRRIIMPPDWQGHPLRKSYPGRATDMAPYTRKEAETLQPLDGGVYVKTDDGKPRLILNIGPHHVSTHGLLRYIVALDGEEISDLDMDIGYHHRGVEKIGERQTWHQFIPYLARVDYLAGAANDLPYLLAIEKLADIKVPQRAQVIRVMLSELFRLSNHLVWFATYAHDVGAIWGHDTEFLHVSRTGDDS